jgi:hypothetical protein
VPGLGPEGYCTVRHSVRLAAATDPGRLLRSVLARSGQRLPLHREPDSHNAWCRHGLQGDVASAQRRPRDHLVLNGERRLASGARDGRRRPGRIAKRARTHRIQGQAHPRRQWDLCLARLGGRAPGSPGRSLSRGAKATLEAGIQMRNSVAGHPFYSPFVHGTRRVAARGGSTTCQGRLDGALGRAWAQR